MKHAADKTDKDKSERVDRLRQQINDLRSKVNEDLDSDEIETRLTALAVKILDETYARVGNRKSVQERGHYGISQLECRHFDFNNGKATLSYTGKKGVDQEKEVSDDRAVEILKERCDAVNENECIFCFERDNGRKGRIQPSDVNDYLDEYDITSKDIRGFHANREMREELESIRDDNGSLPDDEDEREEQLKEEFREALETVSDRVGHEDSTLRNSYLVPHFEDTYIEEGEPPEQFNARKSKLAIRVATRALRQYGSAVCLKNI